MVHVMIIDSGVGGLSVLAYLERFLREENKRGKYRLTYANASPEDDYGYNSMPTKEEKLSTFERFLQNAFQYYQPDFMYLACNTLSVLFPFTPFAKEPPVPVGNIVETGVKHLFVDWRQSKLSPIYVFATPTTIQEGVICQTLEDFGVPEKQLFKVSCPGLADAIAADFTGVSVKKLVDQYVKEVLAGNPEKPKKAFVYLGCTHYGYRTEMFQHAFEQHGIQIMCHNPNHFVTRELDERKLLCPIGDQKFETALEVVSRYQIPCSTQKAIRVFLQPISPQTILSLEKFTYRPDFF